MHNYTIMPLFTDHVEELCEDIRTQYRTGAAGLALFMMTLVPEGNPPVDKAGLLCEKYRLFRDRLAETGDRCGILAQATIGHGYALNQWFPFQRCVSLVEGQEEYICCPYDPGFRDFMRGQFRTMALQHPAEIMVDDDLRLMHRVGRGCACPLHMAAFNRRMGTRMTREELYAHIQGNSEYDRRCTEAFIETQRESVLGAAKAMREGIDSVDPALPGSFCSAGEGAEFGAELGEVLAGAGNPVMVRLNNSNYHPNGAREFTTSMLKAAQQIAALRGRAQVILAETDTCPHNRYSTGANSLHSHFTGSILEGVSGAKHWITRLECYEPESGKAYRKVLSRHAGFYETLSRLAPTLTWQGCRIPLSATPDYGLTREDIWTVEDDGWSRCVLERLGLPMYFSAAFGGAVFLDGGGDWRFSQEELASFFRGPVFLAAETARRLNDRGFGAYTGVEIRDWTGPHPSKEVLEPGRMCAVQKKPLEIVPTDESVRWDSTVCHLRDGVALEPLFPGVSVYRNPLGGTTAVFCGMPRTAFHYTEAFSFLNASRKRQLIRLLKEFGCLPIYYPGDEEVYFRTAVMADGKRLCAIFNIGLDPIEAVELWTEEPVTRVERLTEAGDWTPCAFRREGERLMTDLRADILDPVILRLSHD